MIACHVFVSPVTVIDPSPSAARGICNGSLLAGTVGLVWLAATDSLCFLAWSFRADFEACRVSLSAGVNVRPLQRARLYSLPSALPIVELTSTIAPSVMATFFQVL